MQDVVEGVLAEVVQETVVEVTGQQNVMEVMAVEYSKGLIKEFNCSHPHSPEWFVAQPILSLVRQTLVLMFICP
jgi:hypothetical protein